MAQLVLRTLLVLSGVSLTLGHVRSTERQLVFRQGIPALEAHLAASGGSLSGDGRLVGFISMDALVPSDTNPGADVYVMDRETSNLTLESPALNGAIRYAHFAHPRLSGDGRYVVFESGASDLMSGLDANNTIDVYVRDRLLNRTTRVSNATGNADGNHMSRAPAISDDGRVVAFESWATNLVAGPDANGSRRDIYLLRLGTTTIVRASVTSRGLQPSDGDSHSATLSGDGRLVAFASSADLDTAPTRRERGLRNSVIYVRNMVDGITSCASCLGELGDGHASYPHLSADGRFLVFVWKSIQRSSKSRTDVILHDRSTGETTIVTGRANASSAGPRISGNGRYVAFESLASNLACDKPRCPPDTGDENLLTDIYLFNRLSRQFTRLSRGPGEWWVPSVGASLDRESTVVSFASRQPLGGHDPTTDFDLFVQPVPTSK
jgi:Tol biopolymer transport system component